MNNRPVFAFVMALAAAPAAAQPPVKAPLPSVALPPATPLPPVKIAFPDDLLDALDAVKLARPAMLDAMDAVKLARPDMLDAMDAVKMAGPAMRAAADAVKLAGPAMLERRDAEAAPTLPSIFAFDQDRGRDREAELRDREAELRQREREREAQWYSQGQDAADQYQWDRALWYFNRVIDAQRQQARRRVVLEGVLAEPARAAQRGADDHRGALQESSQQPLPQAGHRARSRSAA